MMDLIYSFAYPHFRLKSSSLGDPLSNDNDEHGFSLIRCIPDWLRGVLTALQIPLTVRIRPQPTLSVDRKERIV